jgi:hypothetical protein
MNQYAKQLENLFSEHLDKFQQASATIESKIVAYLATFNELSTTDAITINAEIDRIFETEYNTVVNEVVESYNSAWLLLLAKLPGTKIDKEVLVNVKTNAVLAFRAQADQAKSKIKQALYNNAVAKSPIANAIITAVDVVKAEIGKPKNSVINGLFKSTSAIVAHVSGKAKITKWRYSGQIDSVTRSWCSNHVGKEFTKQELLDEWQNSWQGKSGSDPFMNRGGYNCRHHLEPVTDD